MTTRSKTKKITIFSGIEIHLIWFARIRSQERAIFAFETRYGARLLLGESSKGLDGLEESFFRLRMLISREAIQCGGGSGHCIGGRGAFACGRGVQIDLGVAQKRRRISAIA